MNVTLGIPRLREILMTAGKNIATPTAEVCSLIFQAQYDKYRPYFPDQSAVACDKRRYRPNSSSARSCTLEAGDQEVCAVGEGQSAAGVCGSIPGSCGKNWPSETLGAAMCCVSSCCTSRGEKRRLSIWIIARFWRRFVRGVLLVNWDLM